MARSHSARFRVGFQSSSACEDYAFQAKVSDLQQERGNECGRRDRNPLTREPGHRTGLPTSVIGPTRISGGIRFRTAFRGGADTKCARMRGRLLYEYTP
jgi:hypothetical protein